MGLRFLGSAQGAARYCLYFARAYGTDAWQWPGNAENWEALGEDFRHGRTAAEVDWLAAREWARTSDDILWRRSKLGLHLGTDEVAALDAYLASWCARQDSNLRPPA